MNHKFKRGDIVTNQSYNNKPFLFVLGFEEESELYHPHYRYYDLKLPDKIVKIEKGLFETCYKKVNR